MRTSDGDNGVSDVGEQPRRDYAARGGPGAGRRIFPRLRPVVLGEVQWAAPSCRARDASRFNAQVLQVSERVAGHQRVVMQPRPGAALEVAEA